MGRTGARLPSFCLNRIRPLVRVRSPSILSKPDANSIKTDQKTENSPSVGEENAKAGLIIGRRIMIVVDSSVEAKGALQWALSHTVQSQDTLILLYVTKPCKQGPTSLFLSVFCPLIGLKYSEKKSSSEAKIFIFIAGEECGKEVAPRVYELLYSMKNVCQLKRPEVSITQLEPIDPILGENDAPLLLYILHVNSMERGNRR